MDLGPPSSPRDWLSAAGTAGPAEGSAQRSSCNRMQFVGPAHSEAKQTEVSECGAEKGLLQDHARRQVARAPQTPNSPKRFRKAFLKAR